MKMKHAHPQKGATLAVMLVILSLLVIFTHVVLSRYLTEITLSNQAYRKSQALQIAEAGLQKAIYEMNHNQGYTGEKNTPFANGSFSIEIQHGNSVTVIGTLISKSRYTQKVILQTVLKNQHAQFKISSWKEQNKL